MNAVKELEQNILHLAQRAKQAAGEWATLTTEAKNAALKSMAKALWLSREAILEANRADVADAAAAGQSAARLDRLTLNDSRIQAMMTGLRQVAQLPDPIGEQLDLTVLANGLNVSKVRVPMGVIAIIYESRPNVTVDAAGLALKAGNAVVLRGGRESLRSNRSLVEAIRAGLRQSGVPEDAIQFVDREEREAVDILVQARGLVDLAIPRGGAGLIQHVIERARVPVIETGVGNCHVYVDASADRAMASNIIVNAKTQRPSVCNAAETLLVHESAAVDWLPDAVAKLLEHGVEIRACERTKGILRAAGLEHPHINTATEEDWATEYLAPILAVKVVTNLEQAMAHIARYGTRHSESIVTEDVRAAEEFLSRVDAAAVYHNASTRFTDGFEFGFGAEIGISTQKHHARGPMGLRELTSYKYTVRGNGQVRP